MITVPVAELEKRWRPLTDEEREAAETKLSDAVVMLDALHHDLTGALDSGATSKNVVSFVVCEMVKRAMRRPDDQQENVSSQMLVTGPYTVQRAFRDTGGDLYVTRLERRILGIRRRAAMVDLTVPAIDDTEEPTV